MRAHATILVLAAVIAAPGAARADGGNDPTEPPPCFDSTDVVGYRTCPAFGEWGENLIDPYVFVDLGINLRHVPLPAHAGVAARTVSPTRSAPHAGNALTFDERIGFGITHGLYVAIDLELGDFAATSSDPPAIRDVLVDGDAAVGLRLPLGPIVLSGELAGGAMAISREPDNSLQTQGLVEARGRAELWLSPWITIGGVAGTSLIDRGQWMAGAFVGFHSRAWGGR